MKTHNEAKHGSKRLNYRSADSFNTSSMFQTSAEKHSSADTAYEPPSKRMDLHTDSSASSSFSQISENIEYLISEVKCLRNEIKYFKC